MAGNQINKKEVYMVRQWSVTGNYPIRNELGEVVQTVVQLSSTNDGYAQFTETLNGDFTSKTHDELIILAKDRYFKKEYADQAVSDAIIKVDVLDSEILNIRKLSKELTSTLDDVTNKANIIEQDLKKSEENRRASVDKLIYQVDINTERLSLIQSTLTELIDFVGSLTDGSSE